MSAPEPTPHGLHRKTLIRFLSERRPYSVGEAAALLGWSRSVVLHHARDTCALQLGGLIRWGDLAWWLLDRWSIPAIHEALRENAHLLPIGLHPIPLVLHQPGYIIHALRAQWACDPLLHRVTPASTFDAYLTDVMHRAIEPETVSALRSDSEFMHAYSFADGAMDE